jgi:phosphatidylserine/phosphatidylglycerophosphate/cardiolipin synthase-like enzyme
MAPARRIAFVVDGAAYFAAAKAAMRNARHSILILGWNFDSRTRLEPGDTGAELPDQIGPLLKSLVAGRKDLRIHILIWNQALPLALSHRFVAHLARLSLRSRRIHYRLDGCHPVGASHHQKIMVIDDSVAFCGGMDFAANRWDTPGHADHDDRRRLPNGARYPPRHDVMIAADGAAAAALGDLVRERWRRVTGTELGPPRAGTGADPWPAGLAPDLWDAPLGIARTEPARAGRPEIRENENLYREAIAAARRWIYLESQYATSPLIADLLAERLGEPDGPDVLLVCSEYSPGGLDRLLMDPPRDALVRRLRAADRYGRFFAGAPHTACGQPIIIHSKVTIVDDRFLRIGSANLNRRSMGFDTECDVALEALPEDPRADGVRRAVRAFLNRLLAEHLHVPAEEMNVALRSAGRLIPAVRALNRPNGRRLQPIDAPAPNGLRALIAARHLIDPAGTADAWRPWRRSDADPPRDR